MGDNLNIANDLEGVHPIVFQPKESSTHVIHSMWTSVKCSQTRPIHPAAMAGMTLSDYLRQELERISQQLTYSEMRERLASLTPAIVSESPAEAVRRERDSR